MNHKFSLNSTYQPAGDQPQAIDALVKGLNENQKDQVLLGVTGSGKTFTMANVIAQTERPTLIMAHNKTLAAQLYNEMKEFFPNNAVEYFVSYYDYYQPEAYIPQRDVYIEKDSSINEQIDLLRHSATRSLLDRRDVIVVSSVSCIYGLGAPELYLEMVIPLQTGQEINPDDLKKQLIELQYERNDTGFDRGNFRVKGDILDVFPSHYEDRAWRLSFFGDELETINEIDAITGRSLQSLENIKIFANSHFVTPRPTINKAVELIKKELNERLEVLEKSGQLLEHQRLSERTRFDLEMLFETGSCKGIENYSRYLTGRQPGDPPPTLFEYLPDDALLIIDESHVTIPQIGGMYNGDRARKTNLVQYGFRLPSALDNRPLKFEEWEMMRPATLYVSATPRNYELEKTQGEFVEQIIRPTGLIDPECIIRPASTQVDDLLAECPEIIAKDMRILVTTLTKKMAENLTEYMKEANLKVTYLHSDIDTLERVEIIQELRKGTFDILVGVNLLREGLDIPECGLVAILDADKEGFLRSESSLVQTIGRAARNVEGKVLLYADKMTNSLNKAIQETNRRRSIQQAFNEKHGITPKTILRKVSNQLDSDISQKLKSKKDKKPKLTGKELKKHADNLKKEMLEAASNLEFEKAAEIRNMLQTLEKDQIGISSS